MGGYKCDYSLSGEEYFEEGGKRVLRKYYMCRVSGEVCKGKSWKGLHEGLGCSPESANTCAQMFSEGRMNQPLGNASGDPRIRNDGGDSDAFGRS